MAIVNIEVEFDGAGNARIILPEGKRMLAKDPAKVAELTQKLAEKMGKITERHKPHSHVHLTSKGETTQFEQTQEGE
jgi:hypothetical protein